MRRSLFALAASFGLLTSLFAADNMLVKLKDGKIIYYDVEDVEEVTFLEGYVDASKTLLDFTILTDSTAEVSYYRGEYQDTSLIIPSKVLIDGGIYTVTSIGENAIGTKGLGLRHIELPSSLTSIGASAFYYCSSLESIEIPSNVTSIGKGAFNSCKSLTSIDIPSNVTSIGERTFVYCTSLTSINVASDNPNYLSENGILYNKDKTELICTPGGFEGSVDIPSSVTSIGSYAFYSCNDLTSVDIPTSVTSIGKSAFEGCNSLTSIVIPSSVTSIGNAAFCICRSLTSIEIPSSITSIGEYVFSYCFSLTSIEIPSSVTSIDDWAFYNSNVLTSVEIPSSVTSIGEHAFGYCSKLTSVTIPSGVTSIGNYAFEECNSLTNIEISSSVTSIGEGVFENCHSLISINVASDNPNYSSEEGWLYNKEKTELISVPGGIKESVVIPSSVTSIENKAFCYCEDLTSVEIPSSVTSIGENAFCFCGGLISINVSSDNPNYSSEGGLLYNKEKTELVRVPDGLTGSVDIPSGVTSIAECAFYGCSGLTSIEIPSSVTSIGDWAFYACKNLNIEIDNSKENIETAKNSFYGCKSVKYLQ